MQRYLAHVGSTQPLPASFPQPASIPQATQVRLMQMEGSGPCGGTWRRMWCRAAGPAAARFAHVQDMDAAATALVLHLGSGMRLQSQAALRLAISRLIEERVAAVVGVADVRRWLLIIGGA